MISSSRPPGSRDQSATPDSTAARTLAWAQETGFTFWFSRETTSTNTIAKSRVTVATKAHESATRMGVTLASPRDTSPIGSPTLYLTERQTAGRGRGDHTWTTPQGALLSTWSYPLGFAPQPILSPLTGLALFTAARTAFPELDFNLKAPNDLFVGAKKIAGLLIETVMMGSQVTCAVGLGFNAGDAPQGLETTATGLSRLVSPERFIERWPVFLSVWIDGLYMALRDSQGPQMSEIRREELCDALNRHPLLTEKVLNVGPLGQIQTTSRLIDWHLL